MIAPPISTKPGGGRGGGEERNEIKRAEISDELTGEYIRAMYEREYINFRIHILYDIKGA